jgi:LPXTG-motif cell wall-anchored protein
MKQKHMKKLGSFLLAGAMALTMFPTFHTEVHAAGNQLPTKEQFATAEELKTFDTNDQDGKNPAKVYFGNNSQKWWIAGSQEGNLTLFAESPLATSQLFEPNKDQNKAYSADWNCDYTSTGGSNPSDVYPNHYGASPLRTTLKGLESSYFTSKEQDLMKNTTVYTNDTKNNSVYSTTNKLYLAYGDWDDDQYVTVGKKISDNLNNDLRIDKDYWGGSYFWLRAPDESYNYTALVAVPGYSVGISGVYNTNALVPAFELNLSSVIFASAAPAASSDRQLSKNDAFTLRHQSQADIGTATISQSKGSIAVTDVTNENTYLVVQNSNGAWAKKVSSNDLVFAGDMDSSLTSFENCKIWLETTSDRITYAEEATQGSGHNVKANVGDNLTVTGGNILQTNVSGNITEITIKVNDGYYLPDDYISNLQGQLNNGLSVTQKDNGFTIYGTPTSDVNIMLPAATQKVYNMAVAGNGTFTTVCKDYQPITANEFTITNNGNVDLENVKVSLTGTNEDKFELSENKVTTIQPNGTTKVTVKPNNDLDIGTYQATLSISADNVNTATTDLQFTVSEHDYDAVVTLPTCTDKGYTTYTCKNCNHSYKGDEVAAKGHTFGEWVIIASPNCDQGGSRKHTCTVCGYVETENLNPTGHAWEDDYTVDKEPTCTEDGSKSIHCKNCDAVKDSTTIPKLGHSFTNYISNNDATCTKDGTKTAKCDRCDEIDTIVDVGTMLEHEYEWVFNNDAACEKNGTETGTCKHCKTTITREKADTALGHEFKNYVSDNNATCTENGTETAKCERCDKTDTRVQENSALGHDLGEWKVIKDATTTETGIKERHCAHCDYKETESIPVISKPVQPNDNSSDKDNSNADTNKESPKTGDQTNAGFFTALLSMSALGIAGLTVLKKKKALEHK